MVDQFSQFGTNVLATLGTADYVPLESAARIRYLSAAGAWDRLAQDSNEARQFMLRKIQEGDADRADIIRAAISSRGLKRQMYKILALGVYDLSPQALEIDHKLLEESLAQHVILAAPGSFVALLRAVAYGWRQEALAKNAEVIREIGQDLYSRLATFSEHLAKLGRSLDSSVDSFNKAVGSFDNRVLPGARRFVELGIQTRKPIPEPDQIEHGTRRVEAREDSSETASG